MQINGYRSLTDALNGTHHAAALGATNKMFWSEYHRDDHEPRPRHPGPRGPDPDRPGRRRRRRRGPGAAATDYPVSDLQASFFFSRSETIWGGTAEIQRNIVGERVLGLPKEPRAGRSTLSAEVVRPRPARCRARLRRPPPAPSAAIAGGARGGDGATSPWRPPAWPPPPTSSATPRAGGLGDPTHQGRADWGGTQEAHGVQRHDPPAHGRLDPQLNGGVGRGDEGDGQPTHEDERDTGAHECRGQRHGRDHHAEGACRPRSTGGCWAGPGWP